jgi:hypothetical protein
LATPKFFTSVHTKTHRISEQKKLIICIRLHNLNLTCLVTSVLHREVHHGTTHELKTWLSTRASCTRNYSLYTQYTTRVWRKKCSYQW